MGSLCEPRLMTLPRRAVQRRDGRAWPRRREARPFLRKSWRNALTAVSSGGWHRATTDWHNTDSAHRPAQGGAQISYPHSTRIDCPGASSSGIRTS